jgi:hypothetical protein
MKIKKAFNRIVGSLSDWNYRRLLPEIWTVQKFINKPQEKIVHLKKYRPATVLKVRRTVRKKK